MTFAIVQKELVVPDLERLARAFCTLPDLTALDAQTAANDAYGILLRGLDAEKSGALQAALTHEGLETEVVRETEFPTLSAGRVIRQIQIEPTHLVAFDPMQRVTRIPWDEILLISAGQVHVRESRRHKGTLDEPVFHGSPGTAERTLSDPAREEEREKLVVDLFLTDLTTRFTLAADEFNFVHLGERMNEDRRMNHLALVRELEEHSPHASLNQGAVLACQEAPTEFRYPTKHAYQEEITWLLWRIGRLLVDTTRAT